MDLILNREKLIPNYKNIILINYKIINLIFII